MTTKEPHPTQPQPVVPQVATPQPYQPQPIMPTAYAAQPQAAGNGLAIAALVVGIIAFLFGWTGIFDLLFATVAIILGAIALAKKQGKGMAVTGLVLGGIALITAIIFTIIGVAVLSQASKDVQRKSTTTGQSTTTSTQHDFTKGTTADFYDISVTATTQRGIAAKFVTPATGNELVRVTLTVKNITDRALTISPLDFEVTSDGAPGQETLAVEGTPLVGTTLQPGATVTGDIVYEVASGSNLALTYSTYDDLINKQNYSLAL